MESVLNYPAKSNNSRETRKSFLNYIHYLRGMAIVLIVGVHVCLALDWGKDSIAYQIVLSLFSNGTILFVFISGFLFYYLSSIKFNYYSYLSKKLKYVIVPYIIVSLPALLDKLFFDTNQWWMDADYDQLNIYTKIFYLIVTGRHSGIFWFIPMISIFYLLAPILVKASKYSFFDYLVPVVVFLGLYTVAFGYYTNILQSFIYFLPVYLFGMFISKHREKVLNIPYPILIVLSLIFLIISVMEVSHLIPLEELRAYKQFEINYTFNYGKLKALILAVILIHLFYSINEKKLPILQTLGDYSFGIFFTHLYIINVLILLKNRIQINAYNEVFTFICFTFIVVTLSMSIVFITKRVFKSQSRLFIGS